MSVNAPDAIEVQDFKFLMHSKIKIFEKCEIQSKSSNLLCSASRFGLVFIGYHNHVKVVQLSSIVQCSLKENNIPMRTQEISGVIVSLAINCDHTILSVVLNSNGVFIIQFYDVTSYYKKDIVLINEVRLSYPVLQISWNPCISGFIAAILEDGTLWACELNDNSFNINSTENNVQALSLSWSPKGKQIVVGTQSGSLCQFKPDLKLVKTINISDMKGFITSVQWLSNYQFVATFNDSSHHNSQPCVAVVNSPKSGQVYSVNYEEVCYNSRDCIPKSVNFIHQPAWSMLFVFSSNSSEVGLLAGINTSDVCNWQQWFLMDDARAEIPLVGKDESYMCGYSLDTGNSKQITIGEKTLLPMPMLHILTDYGFLISYDVLNLKNDAPNICSPPEPVQVTDGIPLFILPISTVPPKANQVAPSQVSLPDKNIHNSTTFNQEPHSNVTMQPGGEFSFMVNSAPITSTPAKHLVNLQNEPKEKPQPILFEKINLAIDKPVLDSSQKPSNANIFMSSTKVNNNATYSVNNPNQPKTSNFGGNQIVAPSKEFNLAQTNSIEVNDTENSDHLNLSSESEENNEAIMCLLETEINYFYKELQRVLERSAQIDIQCGTEVESKLLYSGIDNIKTFIAEANESTQNLKVEVQSLCQTLIEAFSWTNDAKCKSNSNYSSDNSSYNMEHLQNSAELDLLSKHQLSSITKLLYYVDSQILQLNKQIDEQWSEFQEKCKTRAKGKMHIPSMEMLYQTLLKQGDILSKQKQLVQEALAKIRKKSFVTNRCSTDEISKLTNMLDVMNMSSRDFHQIQKERILVIKSQFSKSKQQVLINVLANHRLNKVMPVKIDYNNCKSSIVLDRIRNVKDKKLKPASQTIKSSGFQAELNSYIDKQFKSSNQNQANFHINQSMNEPGFLKNSSLIANEASKKINTTNTLNNQKQTIISSNTTLVKPSPQSEITSAFSIPTKSLTERSESNLQKLIEPAYPVVSQKPITFVKAGENVKDISKSMSFNASQTGRTDEKNLQESTKLNDSTITPTSTIKNTTFQFALPSLSKSGDKPNTTVSVVSTKPANTEAAFSFSLDPVSSSKTNETPAIKSEDILKELKLCSPSPNAQNNLTKPSPFGFSNSSTFGSMSSGSDTMLVKDSKKGNAIIAISSANQENENNSMLSLFKKSSQSSENITTGTSSTTCVTTGTSSELFSKPSASKEPTFENSTPNTFGTTSTFSLVNKPSEQIVNSSASIFEQSTARLTSGSDGTKLSSGDKEVTTSGKDVLSSESLSVLDSASNKTSAVAATSVTTTKSNIDKNSTFVTSPTSTVSSVTSANIQSSIFGDITAAASTTNSEKEINFPSIQNFSDNKVLPDSTGNTLTLTSFTFGSGSNTTTSSSVFGVTSTTTTAGSIFGTNSTASTNSVFGTTSAFGTVNSTSSLFGVNNSNSTSSLTSKFGNGLTMTSNASKSIFGGTNTTTTTSIFGGTNSNTNSTSVFGGSNANTTSIFGNNSSSSISVFGSTPTTTTPAPMFGSQSTFGASPQGNSIFGGNASKPSGSIFGGTSGPLKPATSLFGQQSSFGSASGGSIFGGGAQQNTSGFGTSTTQSAFGNAFGSSSTGFQNNTSTSAFGSSNFNSSTSSIAQGGFGSPLSMNKPAQGGFGSPPLFGSAPSFGSPAAFGSTPSFGASSTFGSTPAFGSPTNAFSNPTSQSSAFSTPTQQSNTFENLASSNVISFGNLAQSSPQQPNKPAAFSGSPSFSSWR